MNVLEEVEGKIVIWAHWQRDVSRIIREISKKYGANSFVDYYGLTPMKDRQDNIKKVPGSRFPCKILYWYNTDRWLWYYINCSVYYGILF